MNDSDTIPQSGVLFNGRFYKAIPAKGCAKCDLQPMCKGNGYFGGACHNAQAYNSHNGGQHFNFRFSQEITDKINRQ